MKFFAAAAVALASVAVANPTACKPGTYKCGCNQATKQPGWDVCNTSSQWVYGGDCPKDAVCKFNEANGSPYCVPKGFQFP